MDFIRNIRVIITRKLHIFSYLSENAYFCLKL